MNKKAQAALEFITTYGWAFLVIIIMIGALAYFGILSPSKLLPSRCNFGTEFQCIDYQIAYVGATTGTFKIRLKNNVGVPIDVSALALSSEGTTAYSCTTSPTNPTGWKSGNVTDLSWSGCNSGAAGIVAGEKGKILVTVTYNAVVSGSAYGKQVKGEVYSAVI